IAAMLLVAAFARRGTSTLLAVGYVLTFLVFLLLRPVADETFIPVHYELPILMDRILFLGALPMVWMQDLFYVHGRVGVLDLFLSGVYITYFFAPHLIALVVWRTRPHLFPKAIVAISLTFMIGLFFYFAVPTAPPWLASDTGDIDAEVVRILPAISAQVAGDTYDQASRAVGDNDVAAMPSLHTALTTMVALIMASYGRRWRWVGLTYVALMGTALVYLGEHYVIDEIAGIALAVGVWKLVSHHRMFAWVTPSVDQDETPLDVSADRRAA
ncbi:MAG TPA: phosphatase PAP2 family protein, partial [Dehalococcoidia bacterium]|nr:phosphatase PAP2 family protein [Dehalococcoidia bacterium]